MKVVICICFTYLFASEIIAQDSLNVSKFKQSKGSSTIEVNLNPISSSPISINYLRFRKFVTDRSAWRLSGALNLKNQKPIDGVTLSSFEINLRPGYEWHFQGTNKLSPYIGFDVDFAIKSSEYSDDRTTNFGAYRTIAGAWDTNGTERGYSRFGSNLLIGADYYFAKKVYLGFEIGYGFQSITFDDISITPGLGSSSTYSKGGSTFLIGSNYNSSFRLGISF